MSQPAAHHGRRILILPLLRILSFILNDFLVLVVLKIVIIQIGTALHGLLGLHHLKIVEGAASAQGKEKDKEEYKKGRCFYSTSLSACV